jgi:hypothetical protein
MRKNGRKDGAASRALTYKTEICRSHHDLGYCEYEDKCQFAHGVEQLRPRKFSPKYKTQLCKNYHKFGNCRFGSRCQFIHDEQRIQVAENEFWLISQSEHLMRIEVVGGASQVMTAVDGIPPMPPVPLPLPPPPVVSPESPTARRAGGGSEVMTLPMHDSMPLPVGLPQGTAPGGRGQLSPTSKSTTSETPPETQTVLESGEPDPEQERDQEDTGDEGENEVDDDGEEFSQPTGYYSDMYGQDGQYVVYPEQFQYHPDLYFGPPLHMVAGYQPGMDYHHPAMMHGHMMHPQQFHQYQYYHQQRMMQLHHQQQYYQVMQARVAQNTQGTDEDVQPGEAEGWNKVEMDKKVEAAA